MEPTLTDEYETDTDSDEVNERFNYDDFVPNESDDEDIPVNRIIQTNDSKLWDSFQDPPVEQTTGSSVNLKWLNTSIVVLKMFTYVFVLLVTLASAMVSKSSFLLMTSLIKNGTIVRYCHIRQQQKEYQVEIPQEQRIAWIWALIYAFCIPEVGCFIRAFRIYFFKNIRRPQWTEMLLVGTCETLSVLGMAILTFIILPQIDVIKGVMLTNCVCFIPAILSMISRPMSENKKTIKYFLDIIAMCCQITSFIAWPLTEDSWTMWLTPVALILISLQWWENFLNDKSSLFREKSLHNLKQNLFDSRYYIYMFVCPLKVICFFLMGTTLSGVALGDMFDKYSVGWGNHTIHVAEVEPIYSDNNKVENPDLTDITSLLDSDEIFPDPKSIFYVLLVQVVSTYICYIFGKFACKVQIQSFSFAFPVNLAVPVTVTLLIVFCGVREFDTCAFHNFLPDYIFFSMPEERYSFFGYLMKEFTWIWLLWLFSQTWITRHIWTPKSDRNASTDNLFVVPLYNGLLIDQSLALNRRQDDESMIIRKKDEDEEGFKRDDYNTDLDANEADDVKKWDRVPQIYICATMWHETKDEVMEFLKSVLRLDEDQCARRMVMNHMQGKNDGIHPDYYQLETHIFFDDAFVGDRSKVEDPEDWPLNSYVKILINSMEDSALEVYKTPIKIHQPTKIETPYGGRLVWVLPGRTRMIAHLKNKNKIRHKKRWSQCMYMYYLLGYKIMQMPCSARRKMIIAQNTYLLALDGDIDFQPKAVHLLVNRMKVDPDLGAACGRIHPVGSGPMVWYQLFEYAIGHWLQKATEHVIGCVLCSPGCFSLFRGRALMENSVMKKYTTKSTSAIHMVQYDQGEDRWLCTLLLKQRFRVEYSAASDAYTHAPEGFNEFYNQRRRWIPSTMANIFDLLGDSRRVVKTNNNISMPYIIYQTVLMVGTILGPGTIFLMMVGSVSSVLGVSMYKGMIYNGIPLLIFILLCYFAPQKYQLLMAFIISAAYALVMIAVLVGIIIQVMEDGLFAPTSMFFFIMITQIVITGLLHPQEIGALPAFMFYYITIPSMYMLLIIYSLFNMNDVSWGTRENPVEATAAPSQQQQQQQQQGKIGKMLNFLGIEDKTEQEGALQIGCSGLFHCMFCTHPKSNVEGQQLVGIASTLNDLNNKLKELELKLTGEVRVTLDTEEQEEKSLLLPTEEIIVEFERPKPKKYLVHWQEDADLKNGSTETLPIAEEKFWIDLIDQYLKPYDVSEEDKKKTIQDLKVLRDMCVFAFCMVNAIFILIVFLLQLNKEQLHIDWPFNVKYEIEFNESEFEIVLRPEYLKIEPIGFMFVLFFGLILVIQFIAMLIHRFKTISQILASTEIDWYCNKKAKEMSTNAELRECSVDLAKILQKPKPQWDENEMDEKQKKISRRDTVHRILYQHQNKDDQSNLEQNFLRNFVVADELRVGPRMTISHGAMQVLEHRRKTVAQKYVQQKSSVRSKKKAPRPEIPQSSLTTTAAWVESTPPVSVSFESDTQSTPPPNYQRGYANEGYDNFGDDSESFEMHERRGPRARRQVSFNRNNLT